MSWLGTLSSVFLGGLAAGSPHAAVAPPQDAIVTAAAGAQQRSAYLHVPAGFDRAREYPQLHDGPAPVILIRVDGLGHQIAGGNDDHLPDQALLPRPDAVAMALEVFARHPMP